MIPQSIKTGFGDASNSQDEMTAFQTRLLALLALMIENSLSNAIVYSTHAGITEVDDALMKRALMVEAIQFFDRETLEEDVLELEESMLEMDEDELSEFDEDEDEDEDELVEGEEADKEADEEADDDGFPPAERDGDGVCRCPLCKRFETIETDWDAWDVSTDAAKQFLKNHIDNLDV